MKYINPIDISNLMKIFKNPIYKDSLMFQKFKMIINRLPKKVLNDYLIQITNRKIQNNFLLFLILKKSYPIKDSNLLNMIASYFLNLLNDLDLIRALKVFIKQYPDSYKDYKNLINFITKMLQRNDIELNIQCFKILIFLQEKQLLPLYILNQIIQHIFTFESFCEYPYLKYTKRIVNKAENIDNNTVDVMLLSFAQKMSSVDKPSKLKLIINMLCYFSNIT